MKKRVIDILLLVAVVYVAYRQAPVIWNSFQHENKALVSFKALDLDGKEVEIPILGQKKVYLFWATWCGPCHKQMDLFKESIASGELQSEDVIALSLGERLHVVRNFQKGKTINFKILADPSGVSWGRFNVMATPSIAFVNEKGIVEYFTAGFSPLAVRKSKSFLGRD